MQLAPELGPLRILLVEDNPGDVRLAEEVLGDRPEIELEIARDGGEALDRVRSAPRPHLMLLDLNLPVRSGLEVLAEVKADPALASMPVVVLTSSDSPGDIEEAYRLQASSYVCKRADGLQTLRSLEILRDYWLELVTLQRD